MMPEFSATRVDGYHALNVLTSMLKHIDVEQNNFKYHRFPNSDAAESLSNLSTCSILARSLRGKSRQ